MPPVTPASSLLAALPEATQTRLREIGAEHRTEFGTHRRYQTAFDKHLAFFEGLLARGADHAIIGQLLAEVGIARADGSPLPLGTISGALSRARERAARPDSDDRPAARLPMQEAAGQRRATPDNAGSRRAMKEPAGQRASMPASTDAAVAHLPSAGDVLPPQSLPLGNATHSAQRAADVLNRIRSTR